MSAFLCSDNHIRSIATVVGSYFEIDITQLADKLKAINIHSVNYRYDENSRKAKCKGLHNTELTFDDIAKLIDSFNYQSCEDNTIDFKAYSTMLELWITENKADAKNGAYWTI